METTGNCYQVHAEAILDGFPGLLCHGTVWHHDVGWHGHCWIELNEDVVVDLSNEHRAVLRRERYYMAGKVKDVQRYSAEQVRELVCKEKNWGTWGKP